MFPSLHYTLKSALLASAIACVCGGRARSIECSSQMSAPRPAGVALPVSPSQLSLPTPSAEQRTPASDTVRSQRCGALRAMGVPAVPGPAGEHKCIDLNRAHYLIEHGTNLAPAAAVPTRDTYHPLTLRPRVRPSYAQVSCARRAGQRARSAAAVSFLTGRLCLVMTDLNRHAPPT